MTKLIRMKNHYDHCGNRTKAVEAGKVNLMSDVLMPDLFQNFNVRYFFLLNYASKGLKREEDFLSWH